MSYNNFCISSILNGFNYVLSYKHMYIKNYWYKFTLTLKDNILIHFKSAQNKN